MLLVGGLASVERQSYRPYWYVGVCGCNLPVKDATFPICGWSLGPSHTSVTRVWCSSLFHGLDLAVISHLGLWPVDYITCQYHSGIYTSTRGTRKLTACVVVSALASINEVNLHWAWLVLRLVTMSGFISQCRTLILVCNQPATQANSSCHPYGVGKWVPSLAG